ncbi:hypothetical protein PGT21_021975 [Puccinia graminis f. sp. tritici]|uniref:Uncharacterized protein n=1 Tax=Puccinia graminis f. sp. tritici TaxID=56615 RepID=A0A5B0PBY2_PUCGR|nr:hypothetical protein PGT21_021975 [Puccinia graminis f. sp. tritici]KAA1117182.1 hypothetical protein PGTUg99_036825 [Puccinia graminis f. sp. tritici]
MLTLVEQGWPGDSLKGLLTLHHTRCWLQADGNDELPGSITKPFYNYVTEIKIRTNIKLIHESSALPDLNRRSDCGEGRSFAQLRRKFSRSDGVVGYHTRFTSSIPHVQDGIQMRSREVMSSSLVRIIF